MAYWSLLDASLVVTPVAITVLKNKYNNTKEIITNILREIRCFLGGTDAFFNDALKEKIRSYLFAVFVIFSEKQIFYWANGTNYGTSNLRNIFPILTTTVISWCVKKRYAFTMSVSICCVKPFLRSAWSSKRARKRKYQHIFLYNQKEVTCLSITERIANIIIIIFQISTSLLTIQYLLLLICNLLLLTSYLLPYLLYIIYCLLYLTFIWLPHGITQEKHAA